MMLTEPVALNATDLILLRRLITATLAAHKYSADALLSEAKLCAGILGERLELTPEAVVVREIAA